MEAKEFYNLAVKLTEDIKNVEPQLVSGSDAELCVLVTAEKQAVYAGVTSVKVSDGKVMRSCPEYNAIMAMIPSGETLIEKLITVSFGSLEVSQPCEDCFQLLYRANQDNKKAQIFTAPDKVIQAAELFAPDESQANEPIPMAGSAPEEAPAPAPAPEQGGFAASSPAEAPPPPAMNKAPKNPLASAADFGDFGGGGDFGFEAAEPEPEPEEEEPPAQSPANPENPFYAQQPASPAAPQTMGGMLQPQPYPQQQPYGYPPSSSLNMVTLNSSLSNTAMRSSSLSTAMLSRALRSVRLRTAPAKYVNMQPAKYVHESAKPSKYVHESAKPSKYVHESAKPPKYVYEPAESAKYVRQPASCT